MDGDDDDPEVLGPDATPSAAREPSTGKRAFAAAAADIPLSTVGAVSATRNVAPTGTLAAGTSKLKVDARSPSVEAAASVFVSVNVATTSPSGSAISRTAVTAAALAPAVGFA